MNGRLKLSIQSFNFSNVNVRFFIRMVIIMTIVITSGCNISFNNYRNSNEATTEQVQTIGDSFFDYSKPLTGYCDEKTYGGIAQALHCAAKDSIEPIQQDGFFTPSAITQTPIIYKDNSRTNQQLRGIIRTQLKPLMRRNNIETVIFNGGANDFLANDCANKSSTGTRDYSRTHINSSVEIGSLLSQKSLSEINQSYVVMGDALQSLTDSELNQYIELLKQPIENKCVSIMQNIETMMEDALVSVEANETIRHFMLIGAPYFNIYTGNQTDLSAAVLSRSCRQSSKCYFVDPRILWLSQDQQSIPDHHDSEESNTCQTSLNRSYTGNNCYADDFTWDKSGTNAHINGPGSYLIGHLIYDAMSEANACRIPGRAPCSDD